MNPTQTPRRLVRSRDDRWIAGVCGGLGRYFGLDPVIIRLAAVALTFVGGAGIIAYAGAWLLVPEDGAEGPLLKGSTNNRKLAMIAGIVLVACGAIGVLDSLNFWFDGGLFWALLAVGAGGFLLLRYTDLGKRFGVTPHTATAGAPAAAAGPAAPPPSPPRPRADAPSPAAPSSTALVTTQPAGSPARADETAVTEQFEGTAITEPLQPLDPPTEPMGELRSPIDELPPNDPGLLEERRARRRRRRQTTLIAFGALLVVLGAGGALVAAGVIDVGTQTFLAGAVVATGVTVVAASFFGGSPALIWIGLVLATGVGVVAASDIPIDKGVGDHVYRPATAASLQPKYELGVGRLWIDMRNTRLPQGTTRVDASVGIGELDVVVPDGARVVAHGTADVGDVKLLNRNGSGTDIDKRLAEPLRRDGDVVPRTVVIDADVGIGSIRVYRGVDSPLPGDGDNGSLGSGGAFGGGFASIGGMR